MEVVPSVTELQRAGPELGGFSVCHRPQPSHYSSRGQLQGPPDPLTLAVLVALHTNTILALLPNCSAHNNSRLSVRQ
jgi:hypothetical protein